MEVYGLFAAHIPQHGRAAMRELSTRTRHGLVPDFMMWIRLGRDPLTLRRMITVSYIRTSGKHPIRTPLP